MANTSSQPQDQVLDDTLIEALGEAQSPIEIPAGRASQLRAKVTNRIQPKMNLGPAGFVTMLASDGMWEEVFPKVEKKSLYIDPITGAEAYLLRAGPGAEAPAHEHEHDEVCIMLDGDVGFDGIKLYKGDYHLAKKGTSHGLARSKGGALIFLQTLP